MLPSASVAEPFNTTLEIGKLIVLSGPAFTTGTDDGTTIPPLVVARLLAGMFVLAGIPLGP